MIGVIGNGFVGKSIIHVINHNNLQFKFTDKIKSDDNNYSSSTEELINQCEAIDSKNCYVICVPTPSIKENGGCDLSIVRDVLKELNTFINKDSAVVIKSTLTPGTARKLNTELSNKNIKLYFSPEFLREASFLDDALNSMYTLVGCADMSSDNSIVINTFKNIYKHNGADIFLHDYELCEMMKYTLNTYLASKVQFFNEIYFICDKLNIKYNDLVELLLKDNRIVNTHMQVPGPDGSFSFGGKCLPKEIRGMKVLQDELKLDSTIFSSIIERNKVLRPGDKNVQGS